MCGKLQCSNVQTAVTVFGIEPWTISKSIGGAKCIGVDFMLGSDVPDPGMVAEGSRCGEGKVRRRSRRRSLKCCRRVLMLISSSVVSGLHEL